MNTEFSTEIKTLADQLIHSDEAALEWIKKTQPSIQALLKMPGDASTRKYYRVWSGDQTFVLMKTDPFVNEAATYPFLVIQSYLDRLGVDVPKVLEKDPARGFILLEDLGDVTLLRELQEVSDVEVESRLYQKVIDELVLLQVSAKPIPGFENLDSFKLKFDYEKLMWEMNFAIEHFYQIHLGRKISDGDRKIMLEGWGDICTRLADEPTVYTHRDFHSRNVMVQRTEDQARFVMIDFQDARMGPAQYDLASLLRDSYYQLEESQIDHLIRYYIDRREKMEKTRIDREHFRVIFDLMAAQRNFKAIGSFASFLNRRGNATYLKYIGNTFENIRRTLLKYPRYSKLREVLFHYYYF